MNKRSSSHSSSSENEGRTCPRLLDNKYSIIKNLGGTVKTKAHLVKDITCAETLAIKIADKEEKEELEREYDFLSSFDHPNIIKPHIFVSEANIKFADDRKELVTKTDEEEVQENKVCTYFTLKFYENGDLFENISRGGPVHEGIARYYFVQLLSAVEYLHSRNIAHRDIKLDNILLDDNFQLMLIDFGFAEELRSKTSEKLDDLEFAKAMGTKGYISPEQFYNDGSDPICLKKCDVFALGVVLFILLKGVCPFESPTREDEFYQYFIMKKKNYFWKMHQKKRRTFSNQAYNILSYEVKSLISDLLSPNPKERPDVSEIKEHPWLQKKDLLSEEELRKMMSERILN